MLIKKSNIYGKISLYAHTHNHLHKKEYETHKHRKYMYCPLNRYSVQVSRSSAGTCYVYYKYRLFNEINNNN